MNTIFLASVIASLKNEKCYGKTYKARASLDYFKDLGVKLLPPCGRAHFAPVANCEKKPWIIAIAKEDNKRTCQNQGFLSVVIGLLCSLEWDN